MTSFLSALESTAAADLCICGAVAVEGCGTWHDRLSTIGVIFGSDRNGLKVDQDYLGDTLG